MELLFANIESSTRKKSEIKIAPDSTKIFLLVMTTEVILKLLHMVMQNLYLMYF